MSVLVVGAGPAGTSTAIALALGGIPVRIVDRAEFPRPRIGESLPPKVGALLEQLGALEAVDSAGFARMSGTNVLDGDALSVHDFDPDRRALGYQVDRARFDQLLLNRAAAVGARVELGTALFSAQPVGAEVEVRLRSRGTEASERFRWVVDASGSSGVLARALGLKRREELRTVALSAYWRGARRVGPSASYNTFFETRADGWCWLVHRADGSMNLSFGLDPEAVQASGAEYTYQRQVSSSAWLQEVLEGARREDEVSVFDATWARAERFIGPGFLLVGDAASVIDPLTSQGVYKALQSGLAAAASLRTILERPAQAALAEQYYQDTQARFYASYAETAVTFYRGSRQAAAPFWAARARPALGPSPVDDPARGARRRTLSAQIGARGGQGLFLRAGPALRTAEIPIAERGFIVSRTCLAAQGAPIALPPEVDGPRLAALLDGRSLEAVFEAYAASSGQSASAVLGRSLMSALLVLAEHDLLEIREG
ncbi:MAG: NAD(P)/FAD-dependent oxidoreductase [Myxococcota bacterium]